MCNFKIGKMTYSKLWFITRYDDSKNIIVSLRKPIHSPWQIGKVCQSHYQHNIQRFLLSKGTFLSMYCHAYLAPEFWGKQEIFERKKLP